MRKQRQAKPEIERFIEKISFKNGCWIWIGYKHPRTGQAGINIKGQCKIAYRVFYERFIGPTNGLFVLHTCDNPACLKPSHLFLGTQDDNIKDMVKKNRQPFAKNSRAIKFNNEKIKEIRKIFKAAGHPNFDQIAKIYGANRATIYDIFHRRTWKHI